jgi:hypothetical protein
MDPNILSNLTRVRVWHTFSAKLRSRDEGDAMNRPTGVTVLAILLFIGTVILILLGIGTFLGGAFIGSLIGANAGRAGAGATGAGIGAMIGAMIGVFFLIGAVLDAVCGYGLWSLKEWGRMLTIVLAGIGLVFAIITLFGSMIHFHIISVFFVLIRMAIYAVIIWYLSQPEVKAAFARASVPAVYPAR